MKTKRRQEIGRWEWGSRARYRVAVVYAIAWWPMKRKVQRIGATAAKGRRYWK